MDQLDEIRGEYENIRETAIFASVHSSFGIPTLNVKFWGENIPDTVREIWEKYFQNVGSIPYCFSSDGFAVISVPAHSFDRLPEDLRECLVSRLRAYKRKFEKEREEKGIPAIAIDGYYSLHTWKAQTVLNEIGVK